MMTVTMFALGEITPWSVKKGYEYYTLQRAAQRELEAQNLWITGLCQSGRYAGVHRLTKPRGRRTLKPYYQGSFQGCCKAALEIVAMRNLEGNR
jgi:hypothetical protein